MKKNWEWVVFCFQIVGMIILTGMLAGAAIKFIFVPYVNWLFPGIFAP